MSDRPDPDLASLIGRLQLHLDSTKGAVVVRLSGQGDYLAASEWGGVESQAKAYGMGASMIRALDDMLVEAGLP